MNETNEQDNTNQEDQVPGAAMSSSRATQSNDQHDADDELLALLGAAPTPASTPAETSPIPKPQNNEQGCINDTNMRSVSRHSQHDDYANQEKAGFVAAPANNAQASTNDTDPMNTIRKNVDNASQGEGGNSSFLAGILQAEEQVNHRGITRGSGCSFSEFLFMGDDDDDLDDGEFGDEEDDNEVNDDLQVDEDTEMNQSNDDGTDINQCSGGTSEGTDMNQSEDANVKDKEAEGGTGANNNYSGFTLPSADESSSSSSEDDEEED